MKILFYLLFLFFISSCGYPDINSVPNFKDLKLTKEELFDLCQLSSNVKSEVDECIIKGNKIDE